MVRGVTRASYPEPLLMKTARRDPRTVPRAFTARGRLCCTFLLVDTRSTERLLFWSPFARVLEENSFFFTFFTTGGDGT